MSQCCLPKRLNKTKRRILLRTICLTIIILILVFLVPFYELSSTVYAEGRVAYQISPTSTPTPTSTSTPTSTPTSIPPPTPTPIPTQVFPGDGSTGFVVIVIIIAIVGGLGVIYFMQQRGKKDKSDNGDDPEPPPSPPPPPPDNVPTSIGLLSDKQREDYEKMVKVYRELFEMQEDPFIPLATFEQHFAKTYVGYQGDIRKRVFQLANRFTGLIILSEERYQDDYTIRIPLYTETGGDQA